MAVDIHRPTAHDSLSLAELTLYRQIMSYRAELGLRAIPLSSRLTATAGRHVVDTRENFWREGKEPPAGANYHSWSDAPYPADHSRPEVMWLAPQRVGTGYAAPGYEITGVGYASGAAALAGWQASPAHDDIISNRRAWADDEFRAIGVGAETSSGPGRFAGRVHHVWFGELADAPPLIRGTAGADRVAGTAFADRIQGRGGADRISGGAGSDRVEGGSGNDRLVGGAGSDQLFGGGGADRLTGGPGSDRLTGGPGRDVLTGGPGADVFILAAARDSAPGRRADRLTDFQPADRIDLRQIDARPDIDGDQPFAFGVDGPGALHVEPGRVGGDRDGDGRDDFQLVLVGDRLPGADDFLL